MGHFSRIVVCHQTEKKSNFFIVIDDDFLKIGSSAVVCYDLLFKCHFVLNLHYAPSLDFFFKFLQLGVYRIRENQNSSSAAVNSYIIKVHSIAM